MLSKEEKRFIKYWEDQRTGGRYKYYLLYILAGTFIASIVLLFLFSVIISPVFRIDLNVEGILLLSFVIVTILTVKTWNGNEKKFKGIIKREIQEGQRQDDKYNDEKLV